MQKIITYGSGVEKNDGVLTTVSDSEDVNIFVSEDVNIFVSEVFIINLQMNNNFIVKYELLFVFF